MVVADDALADDPVARREAVTARRRDDLAGPLVPGDERVLERDDVAALEQVDVGVADAH